MLYEQLPLGYGKKRKKIKKYTAQPLKTSWFRTAENLASQYHQYEHNRIELNAEESQTAYVELGSSGLKKYSLRPPYLCGKRNGTGFKNKQAKVEKGG